MIPLVARFVERAEAYPTTLLLFTSDISWSRYFAQRAFSGSPDAVL
jgi:hypothetical protein